MEEYYRILDISSSASEQEVKQAYRELVKIWHPDRFTHDAKLQKRTEKKLKEINEAYQCIIDELKNPYSRQVRKYQKTERKNQQDSQSYTKQPYNSWICPECLRANYIGSMSCGCGFMTDATELETYKANKTPADLYDAVLFNITMRYIDRANFLTRYLLKRFPYSSEAKLVKEVTPAPNVSKDRISGKLQHFKEYWVWYLVASLFVFAVIISALNPEP
jgi:hypothetical protein